MTTKRIVTGAHYGLRDWLGQRISAVVLAAYTVILLLALLVQPELTYGTWAGLFAGTWMKIVTLLAIVALMYHAWIGVRDIFMDYIKPTAVRLALQVATIVLLLGYGLWAATILWKV